MILGVDAGGTNLDAVLYDGEVVGSAKQPSEGANPAAEVLDQLLNDVSPDRVVVSTTRVLNAAVQDDLPACTNLLIPGVGLSPEQAHVDAADEDVAVEGCVDHRGRVTEPLGELNTQHDTVAVTAKFSSRNPSLELEAVDRLDAQTVALGHEAGGRLGFPSRASTAVANAKTATTFDGFTSSFHDALDETEVGAPVYYLKGDGAMLSEDAVRTTPAHTLRSGPATSALGLVALSGIEDGVCVDVGGTTTDVVEVRDGFPALEKGVGAGKLSTFYEGVRSVDAPVGGDTRVTGDGLTDERHGFAAAFGGPEPTPTDALVVLGELDGGDETAARDALSTLGDPDETARRVADLFTDAVASAVESLGADGSTVVLGGALADALEPRLADALGTDVVVPEYAEVCGAVGCAVARVSVRTHVHIDTARGETTVAAEGDERVEEVETGRRYDADEAKRIGREKAAEAARRAGGDASPDDAQILAYRSFNVVRDSRVAGQITDVVAQVAPGIR